MVKWCTSGTCENHHLMKNEDSNFEYSLFKRKKKRTREKSSVGEGLVLEQTQSCRIHGRQKKKVKNLLCMFCQFHIGTVDASKKMNMTCSCASKVWTVCNQPPVAVKEYHTQETLTRKRGKKWNQMKNIVSLSTFVDFSGLNLVGNVWDNVNTQLSKIDLKVIETFKSCYPPKNVVYFPSDSVTCRQENDALLSKDFNLLTCSIYSMCMLSAVVPSFAFHPNLYLPAMDLNKKGWRPPSNDRIHFPKAKKKEFRPICFQVQHKIF